MISSDTAIPFAAFGLTGIVREGPRSRSLRACQKPEGAIETSVTED